MTIFQISILLFVLCFIICVAHYVLMHSFIYSMRHKSWNEPKETFEPKTAVLLTLRGADPFLKYCIQGLLRQDYSDYTVFFIVDSSSDPALPVVKEILDQEKAKSPGCKCEIVVVDEHWDSCALKCNSLVHVIEKLDESFKVLAILDADTRPFPTWLRQLVEPLSDPRFAATSGLRWYVPDQANWGSLIRMDWNIAAVCQMFFSQVLWGGAFALRREVFFEGGLTERWKHTLTDDVTAYKIVKKMGNRVKVTPTLLMLNREVCKTSSFYSWVQRQMFFVKLYHPNWWFIVGQAFFISMLPCIAFMLAIYGLCQKDWALLVLNICTFLVYGLAVLGAFTIIDHSVRQYLRENGEAIPLQTVRGFIKTVCAILFTQIVYAAAICRVFRMKKTVWRGITYHITGPDTVQMEKFIPYSEIARKNNSTESL